MGIVGVVGGCGCSKWGVGIEHGCRAQAGVWGVSVWAGVRACSGRKVWVQVRVCGGWKHGHVSRDVSDERDGRRATITYLKISPWRAACPGQRCMREDIGVGEGFRGSAEQVEGRSYMLKKKTMRGCHVDTFHVTLRRPFFNKSPHRVRTTSSPKQYSHTSRVLPTSAPPQCPLLFPR